MSTYLDPGQVIKLVADEGNSALRVNVVAQAAPSNTIQIQDGTGGTDKALVTASNALKVDASATTQPVSAASLPLPTGASTSALQTTGNSSLSSIDGKITVVNTGAVVVSSSALPSGASTAAKQDTGNTSLASIDGKITAVNTGAVVIASGTLAATQSGTWTVQPGNTANTTAWKVDGSAVTQPVSGTVTVTLPVDPGYTASEFARNDYGSVNVTTSAYVQLIASTAQAYQEIEIFDSSGQTLKIAFGGAGVEVDKFIVVPGGNGRIKRNIPASTRISIKAVSATASAGEIDLNIYG